VDERGRRAVLRRAQVRAALPPRNRRRRRPRPPRRRLPDDPHNGRCFRS
jgi:hypothetical protein